MIATLKGRAWVNCISPGWIATLNLELCSEDLLQYPANKEGVQNDIANLVLFLRSNNALFITGENITADGGMSILMIYHNDYGLNYNS